MDERGKWCEVTLTYWLTWIARILMIFLLSLCDGWVNLVMGREVKRLEVGNAEESFPRTCRGPSDIPRRVVEYCTWVYRSGLTPTKGVCIRWNKIYEYILHLN